MALGHRIPKTLPEWIATATLAPAPANPFYQRLNEVLQEADFDPFVEDLCRPYYADGLGRRGIPPGIYFRMLFVGYFEGFGSQRAIAWHCCDSRSLREFLGYLPTELTPDHSSLTKVRQRLPEVVHEQVFAWVLQLAQAKGLRPGKTTGVDSTFLEANASLKAIERRDTGDDWKAYLRKLAAEAGIENPSDEDLRVSARSSPFLWGRLLSGYGFRSPCPGGSTHAPRQTPRSRQGTALATADRPVATQRPLRPRLLPTPARHCPLLLRLAAKAAATRLRGAPVPGPRPGDLPPCPRPT